MLRTLLLSLALVHPPEDLSFILVDYKGGAAFSPSNIVPGISFSPDKMLQARIFSYADAHRYRLGTHYEALPVNAPEVEMRAPVPMSDRNSCADRFTV